LVTNIFENYLAKSDNKNKLIFSCGPMPMLKAVAEICAKNNLPGYVSLEILMACGFGACVGCAIAMQQTHDNTDKYKLVCKDGPVFDIAEVDFAS
jgi:dihydroorotate dehydrogenase electron transfer subunit